MTVCSQEPAVISLALLEQIKRKVNFMAKALHMTALFAVCSGLLVTTSTTFAQSAYWQIDGNSGTGITNFVGTTDNQMLQLGVNNTVGLRLLPDGTATPDLVGGYDGNYISSSVEGSSILGGGLFNSVNGIQDHFSTIAGGVGNVVFPGAEYSFIGGGANNWIRTNSYGAAIGGGEGNIILDGAEYSSIVGGFSNYVSINAVYATVAGGEGNWAGANYAFAAGHNAGAFHQGTFVWGDSLSSQFSSTSSNQFLVRASGGVGINVNNPNGASLYTQGNRSGGWPSSTVWMVNTNNTATAAPALRVLNNSTSSTSPDGALSVSISGSGLIAEFGNANAYVAWITNDGTIYCKTVVMTSDRNTKENFTHLKPAAILEKVAALPVTEWNYKEDGIEKKHIGPVAQDFHSAFGLNGSDNKHISVVDEGGVALAAIQGLNEKLDETRAENARLKAELDRLEKLLAKSGIATAQGQ